LVLNSDSVIIVIPSFFASIILVVSSTLLFFTITTKVFFETLEPSFAPTIFKDTSSSLSRKPVITIDLLYNGCDVSKDCFSTVSFCSNNFFTRPASFMN